MEWNGEPREQGGVVERDWTFEVASRAIPATLWAPAGATGPLALVLLGYGGGGHRRDGARVWHGGWYARRGIAAASIDLLGHGERALPDGARPDYGLIIDDIVDEWRGCLDALVTLPEIDDSRIGYRGVSMATLLGIPLTAAEPRIRAAIFAGAGIEDVPGGLFTGIGTRLRQDVPRVTCPVLFAFSWDDELVSRPAALELFDLLGSPDKEMRVRPGSHAEAPPPGATEAVCSSSWII